MKAEVTDVAPCRKRLDVEVPADEVNAVFDESYDALRSTVQIRGFRKGHAPRRTLERKFADDIAKEVRGKVFQNSFFAAMEENNLSPMGEPEIELEEMQAVPGQAFTYSTEVDVRPTFDLPEYKGVALTEQIEEVSDELVEERLTAIAKQFTNYQPVEEAAASGDILEAGVQSTVDGEEFVNQESMRINIEGDRLFGIPYADLEKDLVGLKKDDEKELTVTLPDDFPREEMRGKEMKVTLKVKDVLRGEVPEIDDAFAERVGLNDRAALVGNIRQGMEAENRRVARQTLEQEMVKKLVDMCSFELPDAFMKRQIEASLNQSRMELARQGATQQYLEEQEEELRKSSEENAEQAVRRHIIFDAIADAEKIEISETEIHAHLQDLARSYQTTPSDMLKRVQEMNGLHQMIAEMRDIKVTRMLLDAAEITEEMVPAKASDE